MSTVEKPPSALSELEAAVADLRSGRRDPEGMRQAAERMDRMREAMRQRVGEVSLAVDLVRDARDEA
jgi:hypothetical protein